MNNVDEIQRVQRTPTPLPEHRFRAVLERSFRQHLEICRHCTDDQLCEAGAKLFRTWEAS